MTTSVSDEEMFAFLEGSLPSERRQLLEQATLTDASVRVRLDLMAAIAGVSLIPHTPAVARSPQRGWNRALIAMCVLFVVATVGWGAYVFFVEPPLLHDNFNDNWIDPEKWKVARRPVHEQDGHLRLNNRGSIVTQAEFREPIDLRFRWRWIDLVGDTQYRDTLTVALRTSGEHAPKHSYEVLDGILVVFQAHAGRISLYSRSFPDGNPASPVMPMAADTWFDIRITDDGENVAVYIKGPNIDPSFWERPAVVGHFPGKYVKRHVAIYNREIVAGALHESHVDDVRLERMKMSVPAKQN